MSDAEVLQIDQFVNSLTHSNTVQDSCIDESLTGKCIDYHNDQWFTFSTEDSPKAYINIYDQKCRDQRGVQLVILSGELCKPETYTIYDCVSLATQDDIFVELNLEPHEKYWLNIDGYLHDYCHFFIEVSNKPKGVSTTQYSPDSVSIEPRSNIFKINWRLPDSIARQVRNTQISRRGLKDFKFDSPDAVEVQYNAFGSMNQSYSYQDTVLFPGDYVYRLVLELQDGKKLFAGDYNFNTPSYYSGRSEQFITIPLDYRVNANLEIKIKDAQSGRLLKSFKLKYKPKQHARLIIYKNAFGNSKGIEVEVINTDDNHHKSHFYKIR